MNKLFFSCQNAFELSLRLNFNYGFDLIKNPGIISLVCVSKFNEKKTFTW